MANRASDFGPAFGPDFGGSNVYQEKTVSNIEFTWYSVVIAADPELERERHHEIFYDYATVGHRARNFYGDPTASGAYAPD